MTAGRRALVIGAAGQDGSYLCELLVAKDYHVTCLVRRDDADATPNLATVRQAVTLTRAEVADTDRLATVIAGARPHEIYNFASVSFGPDAWADPVRTTSLGTVAVAGLLEAIRVEAPAARSFHSSSAWVFGRPEGAPQDERTRYAPTEPYGAAKAFGDFLVRSYRLRYGMFCCSGIFYSHESPRRPAHFLTRKISLAAVSIKLGMQNEVVLGEIDSVRDWGYAKDYVRAAWLMLQADKPGDYVIATGVTHSVRDVLEIAFGRLGLDWREHVRLDPTLRRGGAQVTNLRGDATAARERLGWSPSVSFVELVEMMVDSDLEVLGRAGGGR